MSKPSPKAGGSCIDWGAHGGGSRQFMQYRADWWHIKEDISSYHLRPSNYAKACLCSTTLRVHTHKFVGSYLRALGALMSEPRFSAPSAKCNSSYAIQGKWPFLREGSQNRY